MKILIIDDEQVLLDLYRDVLVEKGHNVLTARRGEDGIKIAMQEQPELILLDILMPDMNGFDVAEHLKSQDVTKNIPIYLLTNLPEESSDEKAKQLGVAGYLMKAMTEPGELAKIIADFEKKSK